VTLLIIILVILAFLAVGSLVFLPFSPLNAVIATISPKNPSSTAGIGITSKNNENIGLSDGSYAFDIGTDRVDRDIKIQASDLLRKQDKAGAASLWNRAVGKTGNDTSDAEALIYLEDQRVLASGKPYVTLVVGTALTGSSSNIGSGRDNLQGAYVAQKEYNDGLKLSGGMQVRLLIANAGGSANNVPEVADRIVQAAQQDHTIAGMMGMPFSAYASKAIPILTKANIPMVSQTASSDSLTGASPFFFRVAPPNQDQAFVAAAYAKEKLSAKRVAIFVDPKNTYSKSLADNFTRNFATTDNVIVDTENYTVQTGQQELPTLLQKALSTSPDLIYFSGYSDDMAVLLINLPASQSNVQILGGDALYQLNGYPSSAKAGFSRLHFTTFAYPDEWDIQGLGAQKPLFFSEYPAAFNPNGEHGGGTYGYTRPANDVILSYDATYALLEGCKNALQADKNGVTPTGLRDGLAQIKGSRAIQGVSGQISFGDNGDPIRKAIVILYVDPDGHIKLENNGVKSCFRLGCGG
jgi:ABC-type branched-subunit amino acid transport system substrate-binding protein